MTWLLSYGLCLDIMHTISTWIVAPSGHLQLLDCTFFTLGTGLHTIPWRWMPHLPDPPYQSASSLTSLLSKQRNSMLQKFIEQLCKVYGVNIMSDSKVRHWWHLCKERWTNVHGNKHSGWPIMVTDSLVERVNAECVKSLVHNLSFQLHFSQASYSLIYEVMTEKLAYQKLYDRWVPKTHTGIHKQQHLEAAQNLIVFWKWRT